MPLLPTTMTSAFSSSATAHDGIGGIAGPGVAFDVDAGRPGPGALVLEHRVGFATGAEAFAELLGDPATRTGLGL